MVEKGKMSLPVMCQAEGFRANVLVDFGFGVVDQCLVRFVVPMRENELDELQIQTNDQRCRYETYLAHSRQYYEGPL